MIKKIIESIILSIISGLGWLVVKGAYIHGDMSIVILSGLLVAILGGIAINNLQEIVSDNLVSHEKEEVSYITKNRKNPVFFTAKEENGRVKFIQ